MTRSLHLEVARLVLTERWGALATLGDDGEPQAAMVAYAAEPALEGLLMFLSGLSSHARNLVVRPRASLAVGQADTGRGDPQLLPRVSLQGLVAEIPRDSDGFEGAWSSYLARFPEASERLSLGDFRMFRLTPTSARYVGGFARAVTLSADDLRDAGRALAP